jgi:molybdopterin-biosynthesis enzyme MoeA-like protein
VFVEVKRESDIGTTRTKTRIFCLPGVPKEMKAIFSNAIMPQFKEIIGNYYFVESVFKAAGVAEASLAPTLSRLVNSYPADDIYLKSHPRGYGYGIRMNVSGIRKVGSQPKPSPRPKPKPKLNIQIVSKGKDKLQVEARYNTILKTIKEEIHKLGGRIYVTSAQTSI